MPDRSGKENVSALELDIPPSCSEVRKGQYEHKENYDTAQPISFSVEILCNTFRKEKDCQFKMLREGKLVRFPWIGNTELDENASLSWTVPAARSLGLTDSLDKLLA